jgi:TatD DNase family protein
MDPMETEMGDATETANTASTASKASAANSANAQTSDIPIHAIWFDSHAHLQDSDFDEDRAAMLERCWAGGIGRILLPTTDLEDSRNTIKMALQDKRLVCSVGCHPHNAAHFTAADLAGMRQLIDQYRSSPVVAVGEIGLDYHYDFSPRPVQQDVFKQQIELAHACRLPLILHEREAVADCLLILQDAARQGLLLPSPGVFHCYSGSPETAAILLKMGFYIGVDGPITFKNARRLPEVIQMCPKDRLLLETDSPYLTPVPYRGQRNDPSYLPLIGAKVAEIWELPAAEVARITTENAERLFGLAAIQSDG